MKTLKSSETFVDIYQSAWRKPPEDMLSKQLTETQKNLVQSVTLVLRYAIPVVCLNCKLK